MQHTCDMEAVVSPSTDFGELHAKIRAVWADSGLVSNQFRKEKADEAAMKLAWLACHPPESEAAGRGRPRKTAAAMAAFITVEYFEAITGSTVEKPVREGNNKPRGLEPLVREILDVCGLNAAAKAAIAAAPKLAGHCTVVERPIETAEEYFEWTSAKELLAKRHAKRAKWK